MLKVSKPPMTAPMIVIAGAEGAGKTTLAAQFPNPVFIQAETVSDTFDNWDEADCPDVLEPLRPSTIREPEAPMNSLMGQIDSLIDEEHDYKTCVIDSASTLHKMLEIQLCNMYGVTNVAEAAGGYGKYAFELQKMHMEVIEGLKELRNVRNMSIVVLCHLEIQQLKQRPDGDPVVAFGLDMEKKSAAVWRQQFSSVMAIRMDEYIKGAERDRKGAITRSGRAVMSGDRYLVTDSSTVGYGFLCKNRWDLEAQIRLHADSNPLLDLIPYYSN